MTSRRVMRGVAAAMVLAGGLGAAGLGAAGLGCAGGDDARPLRADEFVSRRVEGRANPEPIDQPGLVIPDGVNPQVHEGGDAPEITGISTPVEKVVGQAQDSEQSTTGPADDADPTDVATDDPAGDAGAEDPSGQYVVFGTVLSKVNNQPIYAHKVLSILDSALRAEAQRNDPRTFRQVAARLIADQIQTQERNELVFAAAQKVLTERERLLAEMLTAQWRNEQITNAGGSLELAKRRWAEEGWDFDERIEHEYRLAMYRVYVQKRVAPLVQVTASDIRRYYDANRDKEFTQEARAKFRVIRIDPRNSDLELPGPAAAERLAQQLREEAVTGGADFEDLARQTNAPSLKESGGLVGTADGWLPRGSYVSEKVEQAVWDLRPGQVTEVIEDGGAFHIARLEDRQEATERPFEDLAVQESIRKRLEAQQLGELLEREHRRLEREAVTQRQPGMLQAAVDMAMQRYPAWAAAK